jgi:hypothetical protein
MQLALTFENILTYIYSIYDFFMRAGGPLGQVRLLLRGLLRGRGQILQGIPLQDQRKYKLCYESYVMSGIWFSHTVGT